MGEACPKTSPPAPEIPTLPSPRRSYLYRGEVVNNAIKMAGSEVGLFQDKAEVRVNMNFDHLSDEELLIRLREETEALLLERRAAGLDNGSDEG